jgi:fructokinase
MILVCGEALIDLFPAGSMLKVVVGGSPFNLAVGLARLETPVAFFGGLSVDYFGTMLVETLQREGVDTTQLKRSTRPTPLVLVSPDAHGHPSYTFYSHDSAVQDVTIGDISNPLPHWVEAIALGSYVLAVEPVGSALMSLAEREARRTVIALDCNLRPALVGPIAAWRERIERFASCASIIKLSDEDFEGGWNGVARSDDLAAHWLQLGVKLVVMTHGARGATAWHRSGRVSVPGLQVEVVDTVGAGDSFHAALLARLAYKGRLSSLANLDQASVFDALRYANLAASLTCGRRGADLPRRSEISELERGSLI